MQARTFLVAVASVALLTVVTAQPVDAQVVNRQGMSSSINGPTVSPYLNLLQINSQGIIPYQNLVTPQIEQNRAIRQQASAINQLQQQVSSSSGPRPSRATGHSTLFMNYGHYYPSYGGRH